MLAVFFAGVQLGPTRCSSDAMLLTAGEQHYFNKPQICFSELDVWSSAAWCCFSLTFTSVEIGLIG